jgi:ribosomal protein S18 acetylase RimI-like enzyme
MDRPAQAIIRRATSRDLPSLEWGGEYRHYRRLFARAIQEAERGRRVLLLAEIGAEVVGQIFIQLNTRPQFSAGRTSSGYLYAFRVKPRYRNQGIGTQLLGEAERVLASIGYARSVISVSKTNPAARRLYERHDYRIFAEDSGEWSYVDHNGRLRQVREPAFVMEKWI